MFYNSEGSSQDDKSGALSLAIATTLHSQTQTYAYRHASSNLNGSAITGVKPGDRIFVASKNKALLNVYSWGKETPEQRIPIPEQLSCLTLCANDNLNGDDELVVEEDEFTLPKYRLPHLLIGGGVSGKLYVWELNSGLLLSVKDAHYQRVTNLKVVADGSLLVSAGKDARCLVWNVLDLIEIRANEDGNDKVVKPLHVFADHSLEISDIFINNSIHQDLKLYTSSKDSTIRVYSLFDFQLLTTFVLNNPVESIVVDSADRVIFAGLSNGNIRQINLYEANKATNVLESKGGYGKIITVTEDQNLTETITYHNGNPVTKLSLSLDASLIISGDSLGKIVACDVVSKQVVKELKETNGGKITNIEIFSTTLKVDNTAQVEKNNRPVPQLKRELNQGSDQDVLYQIPFKVENDLFNVDEYLDRVATESLIFENLTNVDSHVVISGSNGTDKDSKIKELETKISKLTGAYKDLRGMYDELYEEHNSK